VNEEVVQLRITKAESDLKIAYHELGHQESTTDAICFHCQQACEKYLKAFLIFHGVEFPRTHILARLIELCSDIDSEFSQMEPWDVDILTEYATTIRYAEEFYTPTLQEAQKAFEIARNVREFVRRKLTEKGFRL
jgi:HEPN domain-containing protein